METTQILMMEDDGTSSGKDFKLQRRLILFMAETITGLKLNFQTEDNGETSCISFFVLTIP